MRIQAATDLKTRTGNTTKDARIKNGSIEIKGDASVVRKRPGAYLLGAIGTGAAQALLSWRGALQAIVGNTFAQISIATVPGGVSSDLVAVPATSSGLLSGAANAGTYVAAGYLNGVTGYADIRRSTDYGLTWGSVVNSITAVSSLFSGAYGNGVFVFLRSGSGNIKGAISSDDGATWSAIDAASSGTYARVFFGGGLFVLVGFNGFIATSSDGTTWTSHTIATVDDFIVGGYGNGLYMAAGYGGVIYTSPDATTWTSRTSPTSDTIQGIGGGGGIYVAIDINDQVIRSTDGVTWTAVGTISGLIAGVGVVYSNGYFFVCGDEGYAYSADGLSWTLAAPDGGSSITQTDDGAFCVAYDYANVITLGQDHEAATVTASSAITFITPSLNLFTNLTGAANSSQYLMMKNRQQAYLLDSTMTLTLITDADYPGWSVASVTSITRTGAVATVTTSAATNFQTGSSVTIAGAVQTEYNGTFTITVTGGTTFTYPVTGTPATPATGTITATGGRTTVPGIVYLDGTFYVMDDQGVIYGSDLSAPASWSALNYITAQKEPGAGKAIAKSANYVIALKEWSTEFFYDAGNAVGSPLSPVDNGFNLIGCATGDSVANVDGTLFWVSQTKQRGRSVMMMVGLSPADISTPDIERILNADDLANVFTYGIKISGHTFYVLTLKTSNVTIVYDVESKAWIEWTSLTLNGSSVSVTSITNDGTTATVTTSAAHGLSDGDPVKIAGAAQSAYNGIFQAAVSSSTVFTYEVAAGTATPATGTITLTGYAASYFKFTKYVYASGKDLVLHETNGSLYEISELFYMDDTIPIDFGIRTYKIDNGNTKRKSCSRIEIIGNKIDDLAMVRWSNDDYVTNSLYRPVDLNTSRSQIHRCGSFQRRSFEMRYVGNNPVQISAFDIDIEGER